MCGSDCGESVHVNYYIWDIHGTTYGTYMVLHMGHTWYYIWDVHGTTYGTYMVLHMGRTWYYIWDIHGTTYGTYMVLHMGRIYMLYKFTDDSIVEVLELNVALSPKVRSSITSCCPVPFGWVWPLNLAFVRFKMADSKMPRASPWPPATKLCKLGYRAYWVIWQLYVYTIHSQLSQYPGTCNEC